MIPTKQGNPTAASVDQTFNMFGVLLNFLVIPNETGDEISLFKVAKAAGEVGRESEHQPPFVG